MPITTLLIDLDDTLYPHTSGLWGEIRANINRYLAEKMGFTPEEIARLREPYFTTYGTTLRGLQMHHDVAPDGYLRFVHDVPVGEYLRPDPALKAMLESLPQPRWIFTNADADHAQRVLEALDVADCFAGIIDVRALDYQPKPNPQVYQSALEITGAASPANCLYADDSIRNLAAAQEQGFCTVLVGADGTHTTADYHLPSIHLLPSVVNGCGGVSDV